MGQIKKMDKKVYKRIYRLLYIIMSIVLITQLALPPGIVLAEAGVNFRPLATDGTNVEERLDDAMRRASEDTAGPDDGTVASSADRRPTAGPAVSIAPDGDSYLLPTKEETEAERQKIKAWAEKQRRDGRKIVVVKGNSASAHASALAAVHKRYTTEQYAAVLHVIDPDEENYWKVQKINSSKTPISAAYGVGGRAQVALEVNIGYDKMKATWVDEAIAEADIVVLDTDVYPNMPSIDDILNRVFKRHMNEWLYRDLAELVAEEILRNSSVDTTGFDKAIRAIGRNIKEGTLVLIQGDVSPGTTAQAAESIERALKERRIETGPNVAYSPNTYLTGHQSEPLISVKQGHRPVGGVTETAGAQAMEFLADTSETKKEGDEGRKKGEPFLRQVDNAEEAEFYNLFRGVSRLMMTTQPAPSALFAEVSGGNLAAIIPAIQDRPTHESIAFPGIGVGGRAYKDALLALLSARDTVDPDLKHSSLTKRMLGYATLWPLHANQLTTEALLARHKPTEDANVVMLGVSNRPDVGDTELSCAEIVAKAFHKQGAKVKAHDPYVERWAEVPEGVTLVSGKGEDFYESIKGADAIVITQAHSVYKGIDASRVVKATGKPVVIVDGCNALTDEQIKDFLRLGCEVRGTGKGHIRSRLRPEVESELTAEQILAVLESVDDNGFIRLQGQSSRIGLAKETIGGQGDRGNAYCILRDPQGRIQDIYIIEDVEDLKDPNSEALQFIEARRAELARADRRTVPHEAMPERRRREGPAPTVSVAEDNKEEIPLPTAEETDAEKERIKNVVREQRAKGKKICVVQGLGFVGLPTGGIVADSVKKRIKVLGEIMNSDEHFVIGLQRPSERSFWKVTRLNRDGKSPIASDDPLLDEVIERVIDSDERPSSKKTFTATWVDEALSYADVIVVDVQADVDKKGIDTVLDEISLKVDTDGKPTRPMSEWTAENTLDELEEFYRNNSTMDLPAFMAAMRTIGQHMNEDALVLIETTVPPGTTQYVAKPILEQERAERVKRGELKNERVNLAHSFERVMPGPEYVDSIRKFWRVFAGVNEESAKLARKFLLSVFDCVEYEPGLPRYKNDNPEEGYLWTLREMASPIESELCKVMENDFRATTLDIIDDYDHLAEHYEFDVWKVAMMLRADPAYTSVLGLGPGVGGYCLIKDALHKFLSAVHIFVMHAQAFLFEARVIGRNDTRPLDVGRHIIEALGIRGQQLKDANICILGVAYRDKVRDTRYTPTHPLYLLLHKLYEIAPEKGKGKVWLHDQYCRMWPELEPTGPHPLEYNLDSGVVDESRLTDEEKTRNVNMYESMKGADVITLMVPHPDYQKIDPDKVLNATGKPGIIVDTWNILPDEKIRRFIELGFDVRTLGRGHVRRIRSQVETGMTAEQALARLAAYNDRLVVEFQGENKTLADVKAELSAICEKGQSENVSVNIQRHKDVKNPAQDGRVIDNSIVAISWSERIEPVPPVVEPITLVASSGDRDASQKVELAEVQSGVPAVVSRRYFLRSAAVGAAAVVIGPGGSSCAPTATEETPAVPKPMPTQTQALPQELKQIAEDYMGKSRGFCNSQKTAMDGRNIKGHNFDGLTQSYPVSSGHSDWIYLGQYGRTWSYDSANNGMREAYFGELEAAKRTIEGLIAVAERGEELGAKGLWFFSYNTVGDDFIDPRRPLGTVAWAVKAIYRFVLAAKDNPQYSADAARYIDWMNEKLKEHILPLQVMTESDRRYGLFRAGYHNPSDERKGDAMGYSVFGGDVNTMYQHCVTEHNADIADALALAIVANVAFSKDKTANGKKFVEDLAKRQRRVVKNMDKLWAGDHYVTTMDADGSLNTTVAVDNNTWMGSVKLAEGDLERAWQCIQYTRNNFVIDLTVDDFEDVPDEARERYKDKTFKGCFFFKRDFQDAFVMPSPRDRGKLEELIQPEATFGFIHLLLQYAQMTKDGDKKREALDLAHQLMRSMAMIRQVYGHNGTPYATATITQLFNTMPAIASTATGAIVAKELTDGKVDPYYIGIALPQDLKDIRIEPVEAKPAPAPVPKPEPTPAPKPTPAPVVPGVLGLTIKQFSGGRISCNIKGAPEGAVATVWKKTDTWYIQPYAEHLIGQSCFPIGRDGNCNISNFRANLVAGQTMIIVFKNGKVPQQLHSGMLNEGQLGAFKDSIVGAWKINRDGKTVQKIARELLLDKIRVALVEENSRRHYAIDVEGLDRLFERPVTGIIPVSSPGMPSPAVPTPGINPGKGFRLGGLTQGVPGQEQYIPGVKLVKRLDEPIYDDGMPYPYEETAPVLLAAASATSAITVASSEDRDASQKVELAPAMQSVLDRIKTAELPEGVDRDSLIEQFSQAATLIDTARAGSVSAAREILEQDLATVIGNDIQPIGAEQIPYGAIISHQLAFGENGIAAALPAILQRTQNLTAVAVVIPDGADPHLAEDQRTVLLQLCQGLPVFVYYSLEAARAELTAVYKGIHLRYLAAEGEDTTQAANLGLQPVINVSQQALERIGAIPGVFRARKNLIEAVRLLGNV